MTIRSIKNMRNELDTLIELAVYIIDEYDRLTTKSLGDDLGVVDMTDAEKAQLKLLEHLVMMM